MSTQTACERCGKPAANSYTFHYGREVGTPDYGAPTYQPGVGTTVREVHHFEVGGSQTVPVCGSCVARGKALDIAKGIADVPLLWLALFIGVMWFGVAISEGNILLALAAVAAIAVAFVVFYLAVSETRIGEELAIKVRRESLKGWTTFWTTDEYKKLSPGAARFGPLAR